MRNVLTIAGSDSSGGAGIQADLKTMTALGVYGQSVITALTAQNTQGVMGVLETPPDFLALQLDAVFNDIIPDAVKIGMVSNSSLIKVIARKLNEYHAKKIVLDPVMVATSGDHLSNEGSVKALKKYLIPLASLVTPNLAEAQILAEMTIVTKQDVETAALRICDGGARAVLIKGGHLGFLDQRQADDYLLDEGGKGRWINTQRIDNPNTHGTGCTLSSAIACYLAWGFNLFDAICRAKGYLLGALEAGLDLGKGSGPLNHSWNGVISER